MIRANKLENIISSMNRRGYKYSSDFRKYIQEIDNIQNKNPQYINFIPTRLCTILEVHTKSCISDLIDFNYYYVKKIKKICNSINLNFDYIIGIVKEDVTVGDIISSHISINSWKEIIEIMGCIIDGFENKLKNSHERFSSQKKDWKKLKKFIENYSILCADMNKLFYKRNILTHELTKDNFISKEETQGFIVSAVQYIEAMEWVMIQEKYGSVPLSQAEITIDSCQRIEPLYKNIEKLNNELKQYYGYESKIDESHKIWHNSAIYDAEMENSGSLGGSIHTTLVNGSLELILNYRIKYLEKILNIAKNSTF